MSWHVLTDGDRYWGQRWESFNTALRRPRSAMGTLQDATMCNLSEHRDGIRDETRRAGAILGLDLYSVPVRIEGSGKDAKIVLEKQAEKGQPR